MEGGSVDSPPGGDDDGTKAWFLHPPGRMACGTGSQDLLGDAVAEARACQQDQHGGAGGLLGSSSFDAANGGPNSTGRVGGGWRQAGKARGQSNWQHDSSAAFGQPQEPRFPGWSVGWLDASDSGSSCAQGGRGASGPCLSSVRQKREKTHHFRVINRQITMMANQGDLAQLLSMIQVHLPDMNGFNLSTAFHRVAKLSSGDGEVGAETHLVKGNPIFKQLLHEVKDHIIFHSLSDGRVLSMVVGGEDQPSPEGVLERRASYSTRDAAKQPGWEMPVPCMSIVTWSCATMRIRDRILLGAIAGIVSPRLDTLKPFELSNLLWAYAKVSLVPSELFGAVGEHVAMRGTTQFKGERQCLSTVAWSLATAEHRDLRVFAVLAEEIKAVAAHLKTQEISNILWAFAKSRAVDVELFTLLGNAAMREPKIWTFKSQELSNTVWAFATIGLHHPQLFEKIEKAAVIKRHDMVPQNISNILWSYAKLQVPSLNMFLPLLEVACGSLASYKRQELSTVIWAAAQVCPQHREFFSVASKLCCRRLREFSPIAIANLIGVLSCVDMYEPGLFISILREGTRRLPQFNAGALCIMLRGCLKAFANPTFQTKWEDVAEILTLIAAQLMPHVHCLRTFEIQEVAEDLRRCSIQAECCTRGNMRTHPPAFAILEQALCGELSTRTDGKAIRSPEDGGDDDGAIGDPLPSKLPPISNFYSIAMVPSHGGGPSQSTELAAMSLGQVGPAAWPASAAIASGPSSSSGGPLEEQLRSFSVSCLTEQGPEGSLRPFDLSAYSGLQVIGIGDHSVSLRHGVWDVRVVLKRLSSSGVSATDQDHPNLLQPLAMITTDASPSPALGAEPAPGPCSQNCIAYVHCKHGSLADWMESRLQEGRPVSVSETAHISRQLLSLVEALLPSCTQLIGVLQPDGIFIDEDERPRLRRPLPGNSAGWGDELKWMSPGEVSGEAHSNNDWWPALCFRIGMLLYFMNTGVPTDPYPQKTGETVIMQLLTHVCGSGPCIRPDLEAYRGPEVLKTLIAACLQTNGQEPPARAALTSVLNFCSNILPTSMRPLERFAM